MHKSSAANRWAAEGGFVVHMILNLNEHFIYCCLVYLMRLFVSGKKTKVFVGRKALAFYTRKVCNDEFVVGQLLVNAA